MLRSIKTEIRIVGIDDGFFEPHTHGKCEVIGIVFRGGYWIDGVMRTQVEVDGMDATEKISHMIMGSPHYGQLRVIMLDGVTFAGFNIVDTTTLFETTSLPVISITRARPSFSDIRKALKNLPFTEERWAAIRKTQKITEVSTGTGNESIYMQAVGIDIETAKKIVESTATRSNIPEPLRVAHLIASGLTSPQL
jgi:endonuclease V-like protein UPF0215 family